MKGFKVVFISFCIVNLIFSSMLYASIYEVQGQINWENQPCREATVFLVRDKGDGTDNFMSEFQALERTSLEINKLTNQDTLLKEKIDLMQTFRQLIKKYRVRKRSVNKEGRFYFNSSGATQYYLI